MTERSLIEGHLSRKKRKALIDKMAAQLILQLYLDSIAPQSAIDGKAEG